MNKIIFKIVIFFIGNLTAYSQELKEVLKADTIYVNINKGFSIHEGKNSKSVHLPCYKYYYFDSEVSDVLSFNTCRWLDEDPPEKKYVDSLYLKDKIIIDLDYIKKAGFKIVSRKFRGKKFYIITGFISDKIELTEAEFGSTYEGSVNDHLTNYIDIIEKE